MPLVPAGTRFGAPVAGTRQFVAIGLNYRKHAQESGLEIPKEPVVFTKALTSIAGPNDDVELPEGSVAGDWDIELGEWWNDYTPNGWLIVDADLAISQARFATVSNGGTHVPNSIPLSASMSLSADRQGAWFGGLRLRYLGAYPLEETGTRKSTPFATVNLKVGYRFTPQWRVTVDVLNLFDRQASDIEYWGSSCTRGEGPACNAGAGFDGKLVHPLEPRTVRASLRAGF